MSGEGRVGTGATYDAEDGVALAAVLDGVVDDAVFLGGLFALGVLHVCETLLKLAHVDLSEAAVEEDFCGEELELEA